MLEPIIRAGAGQAGFIRFREWTVSHRLVGVGANDVGPFGTDVVFSVGVGAGPSAGAGFGLGVRFVFGFGIGIDFSCLPSCSCWRTSGFSRQPV